jgi:hypothetical protein
VPRVNRRKKPLGHGAELTAAQELDLVIGGPSAFPSEQARREAWRTHRDEVRKLVVGLTHAEICFEHGGFLPGERIIHAEQRIRETPNVICGDLRVTANGRELKSRR